MRRGCASLRARSTSCSRTCHPFRPKTSERVPNTSGLRDVAIVGVGATPYYKRGGSLPKSITELAGEAILAACEDAGLSVTDIDGFAYYSGASAGYTEKMDTADFVETLGIPEVRFTAALTSGGGGSAGAIGLARAAIGGRGGSGAGAGGHSRRGRLGGGHGDGVAAVQTTPGLGVLCAGTRSDQFVPAAVRTV